VPWAVPRPDGMTRPAFMDRVVRKLVQSDLAFALTVSLVWVILHNARFWLVALEAMPQPSARTVMFIASLIVTLVLLQSMLLLLLPRTVLRPAASLLFVAAALVAYFSDSYGVYINKDMMLNIVETDASEVAGLISPKLFGYLFCLGVLPALAVWGVVVAETRWQQTLRRRGAFAVVGLLVVAVCIGLNSASYLALFGTHKALRFLVNPGAIVYETGFYVSRAASRAAGGGPLMVVAEPDAHRVIPPGSRPLVMFLVIGETARAASFQLGGYERATNPQLAKLPNAFYFSQVTSCGTATAVSLPCIFSPLGRERFDGHVAKHSANLLDALTQAGVDVEWRDNNSGCKGICARVASLQFSGGPYQKSCQAEYCYDDVMLDGIQARLRRLTGDTMIVFHQIGSHGPAYAQRYPPDFSRFEPVCKSNQLDQCTPDEVRNAYDNSILYTDHNLGALIEVLQAAADRMDAMLLYVSDHGESLGERGIYLHGMPYAVAPRQQIEVPMLAWLSDGYLGRTRADVDCLRQQAVAPWTHDNVYHTVLGAMGVRDRFYREGMDMLGRCRREQNHTTQTGQLGNSRQPDTG